MRLLNLIALCFCTILVACGGEPNNTTNTFISSNEPPICEVGEPAPEEPAFDDNTTNTTAINTTEGSFVLPINDFEAKLKATENAQLIDVRTPEEFAAGSLPNALNINFYADNFKAEMDKLDKTRPVFVFCAKGGRSGEASEICKGMGFKLVYDMEGGYMAWTAK